MASLSKQVFSPVTATPADNKVAHHILEDLFQGWKLGKYTPADEIQITSTEKSARVCINTDPTACIELKHSDSLNCTKAEGPRGDNYFLFFAIPIIAAIRKGYEISIRPQEVEAPNKAMLMTVKHLDMEWVGLFLAEY